MQEKLIILSLLSILPIVNRYSFWFYVIQLKEYRIDRFKEYLSTPQGKKALYNNWLFLEIPLLIFSLGYFINPLFEGILINIVIIFLILGSLFSSYKFFKNTIKTPKITSRFLVTLTILLLLVISYFYILNNVYFLIFSLLITAPFLIFLSVFISLPIVNYFKSKKIKLATNKSIKKNKPIKIGITGSYGKSSVKEYLRQILELDGLTLSTPKNINTELGVSDLILNKLKNKYKYFIAEMGAYKIGEIDLLGRIVNHKYGFLTAIGNQHLALFGGIKNTIKGKSEIANSVLKNKGILYVNGDNKEIKKSDFHKKLNIVKYGLKSKADAKSEIIERLIDKTKFNFYYKGKSHKYITNLVGDHNILNLTGILAFCYDQGIDIKLLKKALKNLNTPDNTQKIIKTSKNIIIDDSYNLSEEGLFSGLSILNNYDKKGNKILIIDDILELGIDANKIIKKIAVKIAKKKMADKIFYVGVNYKKSFYDGLLKGGFKDKDIISNINEIKKHDVILLEGRKSGNYLKILTGEKQ